MVIIIISVIAAILTTVAIIFLIKAYSGKAKLLECFSSGNVIVFGKKGKGKDLILKIDLKTIKENIKNYKAKLGEGKRFCAVVKADCYGLGSKKICKEIDEYSKKELAEIDATPEKKELDMAILAKVCYNDDENGYESLTNYHRVNWDEISGNDKLCLLYDAIQQCNATEDETGLRMEFFKNDLTGEYTIAFQGTDFGDVDGDFKTDILFSSFFTSRYFFNMKYKSSSIIGLDIQSSKPWAIYLSSIPAITSAVKAITGVLKPIMFFRFFNTLISIIQ